MAVTTQAPRDLTGCKVNLYLEVGTKSWTIDNVTIVDDLRNELVIKGDSGTQKIDKREVVDMEILKLPSKNKMNEDKNMSFREFLSESKPAKYNDVRKWVFAQLEDSDMDSEEMEKEFIKKFGKDNLKHYEAALSEYMD